MKRIFLISGKARNGKDSLADILETKLYGKSTRVALARDLKLICKDFLGWDGDKTGKNRNILLDIGTEKIRKQLGWVDFHVNRACETIKIIEDFYENIFICDCRFPNEIEVLKEKFPNQCVTIRVNREDFISPLTEQQQLHESETSLDTYDFDYYINSKSGLDNLEKEIDKVLGHLISKDAQLEDLIVGNKVEITKIIDTDKAGHLKDFIGCEGYVFSWIIIDDEKRYKVITYKNGEELTSYFRREELKLIEG